MTRKASIMMLATYLAVCGLAGNPEAAVTAYHIQDLGRLGGMTNETTSPEAINSAGQVVGTADNGTIFRAFLWTQGKGMQDLGTLGGKSSRAHAINSLGQIVGEAETAGGQVHAVLWNPGQAIKDLGVMAGHIHSIAYGINDAGVVVGESLTDYWVNGRGCFWTPAVPGSSAQDLGTLGGDTSSARGINNSGQIAGFANKTVGGPDHACLWAQGQKKDLGVPAGGTYSRAYAINAAGNVVGIADYLAGQGLGHAFYWDHQTETMQDIDPNERSIGLCINDFNQAVGDASGYSAPFLWTKETGTVFFNNLQVIPSNRSFVYARGINHRGQIVGFYNNDNESGIAYLLTPVAQPPLSLLLPD